MPKMDVYFRHQCHECEEYWDTDKIEQGKKCPECGCIWYTSIRQEYPHVQTVLANRVAKGDLPRGDNIGIKEHSVFLDDWDPDA